MRNENNHQRLDELFKSYLKEQRLEDAENHNLLWNEKEMGEKEEVFSAIKNGIDYRIAHNRKQKIRRIIINSSSVAASVILIISLFFINNHFEKQDAYLITQTNSVADSVILSDGTTVILSPNSAFSYPKKFKKNIRDVSLLKGNAFFKVTPDKKKPFVVTSGVVKTKVLGTSFNVHLNRNNCYVVVHTGKVNVSSGTESVDLLPSQEARYIKKEGTLSFRKVNAQELKSWYNSDITLTNQSIETIFRIIERKYGIDSIAIPPELLQQKATVVIEEKASLKSLIAQINYITNLKFKIYDGIITCKIKPGNGI
jgi:ferric-dicitrate binding protein FerR (iron transport regulator)